MPSNTVSSSPPLLQQEKQQEVQILNLPNEILSSIFHFLDNPPPSSINSLSKPEHSLTFSKTRPLKCLSQTNKHIRSLSLPLLFQHVRFDPYYLPTFLSFIAQSGLTQHVNTATAQLQGPCNHIHPSWWMRLINQVPNLTTLTVLAAPHVFAEIGQVPIDTSHSWAFKIPYHSMTLSLACSQVQVTPASDSKHQNIATQADTTSGLGTGPATQSQLQVPNLLTANPWVHLTFNESSHLAAYSTYEYFLKTPPSLLTSLIQRPRNEPLTIHPSVSTGVPQALTPATNFVANLLSFSYIAVFPFYNHVDDILKCVRQMKKLKRFFVKLCPEPESTVLQDELERNAAGAGRTEGRIDVNDPWNEFDTSYTLIPHTIIYLTTDGSLEEFQTDDVKMSGIRDTLIEDIDRRLNGLGCWSHTVDGVWKRDMGVKVWSPSSNSATATATVAVGEAGMSANNVDGGHP